ncbi:iron-sulfur protein I [Schizosaccharomyces octosporus yFS286]|uniref:Iron-sulfur protein I n=1 Tax=Schizosaccharomyces octosporus (strain yFS286) TaxID=483514 RepID=S9PUQ5_SCHOY|nr:iron-sulfur protein I [Schizosaccharomyces octosporus yFS286]EPX71248.1 iron-sulfur protein I [Schizosaccharomyces octosporus yFS286]
MMNTYIKKSWELFPTKKSLNKLLFRNWQVPRNHISTGSYSSMLLKCESNTAKHRPSLLTLRIPHFQNQSKIYWMQQVRKNSTKTADQYTLQEQYDESGKPYILHMSESAKQQLEKVANQKQQDTFLRVVVDGGGCHGYQISFKMDDQLGKEDSVFVRGKARIVTDSISLPLISGSEIVYTKELIGSSFQLVNNPRAKSSCGCNVSFDLN